MMMGPAFGMMGMMELMVLAFGGGSPLALPVGLPPLPPDAKLAQVAPDDCLIYITWAGNAKADPKSKNQTERLLAEKQVQHFFKALTDGIIDGIEKHAARDDDVAVVGKTLPRLIKTALTRPTAIYLSSFVIDPNTGGPIIEAGMVVHLGKQKADSLKQLDALEGFIAKMAGGKVEKLPADKGGLRKLPISERGAPTVAWGIEGEYLLLAVGDATAARLRGALTNGKPGGPDWLKAARKRLPVKRESSLVYINANKTIKELGEVFGRMVGGHDTAQMLPKVTAALGLDKINMVATVSGLDDTGFVSRTFVGVDGKPGGLFALVEAGPLAAKDLADVPVDADIAFVARLNPTAIYDELVNVIGKIDPDAKQEFLREVGGGFERETGLKLRDEFLASMGDVFRIYNSPNAGGLLITGLTGVADVKDHDKAKKVVATLEKLLDDEFNGRFRRNPNPNPVRRQRQYQFKKIKFAGENITFINPIGDDWVVAPAWCLTKDRFVIAPYPQMVKAYLSRRASIKRGTQVRSLADQPKVKALFDASDGPTMVSFVDTKRAFRKLYPLAHAFATLIFSEAQREGFDLDVSILPTASAILRHLSQDTGTVTRTADGLVMESRGTLPVGGAAALVPMVWLVSASRPMQAGIARANVGPAEIPTRVDPVTPVPPRPAVETPARKRLRATSELRQIGVAVFLYHAANGKAPDKLADLTPKYVKKLGNDPWGKPYLYHGKGLKPAGANASKTPFAATAHLVEGKRLVVYGDGHVEAVTDAAYKKQMQAAGLTYKPPVKVAAPKPDRPTATPPRPTDPPREERDDSKKQSARPDPAIQYPRAA